MLVVLGLGPGSSDLITVRGTRLLSEADRVFVPGKIARSIVEPYTEATVLDFPMTYDEDEVMSAMERNCDRIAPVALNGTAVLGILGDPCFYSTYERLRKIMCERYPQIEIRLEPGISSMTAFASRIPVSVNSGMMVTDGSEHGCLLLMKVRDPLDTVERLRSRGYNEFFLVEHMCMENEKVYCERDMPGVCDYMSVMFARK